MIREWAPSQTHNISLSGRSGKTVFNVGLGYLDQNGLMKLAKHDDFRRWNGSIRLSTEINKYITARAGANYSKRNKRYAYATNSTTADPWLYLYRWDSTYPIGYDENGNEMRSPASEIHQANTANKENNYLSFNVGATLQITKDWKFDIDYTYAGEDQIWKKTVLNLQPLIHGRLPSRDWMVTVTKYTLIIWEKWYQQVLKVLCLHTA